MKNVSVVITPRVIKTNSIMPSGKLMTRIRTAKLYFCMISVMSPDPLIMFTEQKNNAIFYTDKELKIVKQYLIENKIDFIVLSAHDRKNNVPIEELTSVNKLVNTSIIDFI
jgi:hypothetical protein